MEPSLTMAFKRGYLIMLSLVQPTWTQKANENFFFKNKNVCSPITSCKEEMLYDFFNHSAVLLGFQLSNYYYYYTSNDKGECFQVQVDIIWCVFDIW